MKYVQIVLDNKTHKELEKVVRISGKSKQDYLEDLIKEEIKNCQKKKKS